MQFLFLYSDRVSLMYFECIPHTTVVTFYPIFIYHILIVVVDLYKPYTVPLFITDVCDCDT